MQSFLFYSLAFAAAAVSASPVGSDYYVFKSGQSLTDLWQPSDAKGWRFSPVYEGDEKSVAISWNGVPLISIAAAFPEGKPSLTLYLNDACHFIPTIAGSGQCVIRLSKKEPKAYIIDNGKEETLKLDPYNPVLARTYKPVRPSANGKVLLLDSGLADKTYYGDSLLHGTVLHRILAESVGDAKLVKAVNVLRDAKPPVWANTAPVKLNTVSEKYVVKAVADAVKAGEPVWINLSLSWLGKSADAYDCMAQWAYKQGFRVVKAAGNTNAECDKYNPYVMNVGVKGGCSKDNIIKEDGTSYNTRIKGCSVAAAKYTGFLASKSKPAAYKYDWIKGNEPDFCKKLDLPAEKPSAAHWDKLLEKAKITDGKLLAYGTSPNKRTTGSRAVFTTF